MQRLDSVYFDVPALRPGSSGAYALALLCAGTSTALRIAIDPYVTGVMLITFLPGVIITALISGFGAGLCCVVLSAAAADFFVIHPRWAIYIEKPAEALDLLVLILVGLFVVIVITGMRSAIERNRELRRKLEQRVEERGAELADVHKRLEREATFRAMFNVSSVGKIEVEPETGRFLRANEAMCKFLGYSEAELLARTVFDITHPDYLDRDRELLRQLLAGESAFDVEKRYIRKDGRAVWARTTVNVIRDEFGRPLRNTAVIQDINARKQAEQDLRASKDRLQFALDAAQLGWWQYDPVHRVVLSDSRLREMFEVAEERVDVEEFSKRVHPDDIEKLRAAVEAALDPTDPKPCATEFRVRRGEGEVRWMEAHGLVHFEGAGRERRAISMVGTAQDITERKLGEEERKEREEKERLLIREINHRAKNMLTVVDAIARQTATREPKDFVERFSERIQALSAHQDLLVQSQWEGVDVEDLVRTQLSHFADLIGSRIVVDGPKLRLKPIGAEAVGLALHELATNAGKYGALSADTGRVKVCWGADGDTFAMSWTERDGPPVSAPERRGFGTIVITAMAERSVQGTVNLDYAPSGVTWRLTCPAANALEPAKSRVASG